MAVISVEVTVGARRYRVTGDRVWVRGFGTTGPGQTPHYNWISVDKASGSYREAMTEFRKVMK